MDLRFAALCKSHLNSIVYNMRQTTFATSTLLIMVLANTALLTCHLHASAAEATTPSPLAQFRPMWQGLNRSLMVEAGSLSQNYTEYESYGLTLDGIINTERGYVRSGGIGFRWQGDLSRMPLWVQGHAQRTAGRTDYQGYIQGGSEIRPFRSRTGNVIRDSQVQIGIPLIVSENVQIIPAVELANHLWRRELIQYQESFKHRSYSVGMVGQWRVSPQWMLEGVFFSGQTKSAAIAIAEFGFDEALSDASVVQAGLSATYVIGHRWSIGANWALDKYSYGATAVTNSLQYPDSKTLQNTVTLRLSYHY